MSRRSAHVPFSPASSLAHLHIQGSQSQSAPLFPAPPLSQTSSQSLAFTSQYCTPQEDIVQNQWSQRDAASSSAAAMGPPSVSKAKKRDREQRAMHQLQQEQEDSLDFGGFPADLCSPSPPCASPSGPPAPHSATRTRAAIAAAGGSAGVAQAALRSPSQLLDTPMAHHLSSMKTVRQHPPIQIDAPPRHLIAESVFGPELKKKGYLQGGGIKVPAGQPVPFYTRNYQEVDHCLGKGSTGKVIAVRSRVDGWLYALKKIELKGAGIKDVERREVMAMAAAASCPNVVRYHSSWTEEDDDGGCKLYILMELCRHTLQHEFLGRAGDSRRATLENCMDVLLQGAAALQALHAIGIVHMDVKPENTYRAFDGSIKLGDLGGCGMPNMPPASGTYGDKRYLAHEGVTGLGGRTCSQGMSIDDLTKLDVFALGMTVFEIARGRPFSSDENSSLRESPLPHDELDHDMQLVLLPILRAMTSRNPADRPCAAELLQHPDLQPARHRVASQASQPPAPSVTSMFKSAIGSGSGTGALGDDSGDDDERQREHRRSAAAQEEADGFVSQQSDAAASSCSEVSAAASETCSDKPNAWTVLLQAGRAQQGVTAQSAARRSRRRS